MFEDEELDWDLDGDNLNLVSNNNPTSNNRSSIRTSVDSGPAVISTHQVHKKLNFILVIIIQWGSRPVCSIVIVKS